MQGERYDWFPTPIWHFDHGADDQLNQALIKAIKVWQSNEPVGLQLSNSLGWHSQDKLHLEPELLRLNSLILQNALAVVQFLKWDLQTYRLSILNCWAMVNKQYSSNILHSHPNSFLSGVYYVQAPDNCGALFFRDPREMAHMYEPPITEITLWTLQKVTYTPVVGRMIIFPSWLLHGVEYNMSTEERISISFNLGLTYRLPT